MRIVAPVLLAGAATAASVSQQVVLKAPEHQSQQPLELKPEHVAETSSSAWRHLKDSLKGLTTEAQAVWDEVAVMFPEEMSKASFFSLPKKHTRRPDSEWDHIVRGEHLQSLRVMGSDGESHREIDGKLSPYDLRVKKVDPSSLGVDPGVKQYSGYLDDNENDKHLFYWFFESRNDPENDPVVLWLNGGPGCSSMTGLFFELGPSSIDKNAKPVYNDYSWNSNASVIFLDQPVNSGFSYSGSSVSNSVAAGKDVYALLTLFFKQFPEYAHQDFHIAGESYAGHYIPVFTSEILSHKKRNINLKSVMIGNGLTDGFKQYEYYRPMACGEGGYPAVLSESECQSMDNALPRCQSLINSCYDSESAWSCVPAAIYCNNAMIGPYQRTGQNVYDIRKPCEGGNLCYPGLDDISKFLNKPATLKAIGAEVDNFESCNFDVNRNFLFAGDWMKPFHRLVPSIIEEIPVLVYAGDADYICNWLGNYGWTDTLEYPGHADFSASKMKSLKLGGAKSGDEYGRVRGSGNFTFMQIYGAGHMVPYDQPAASLDFLNRWISGEWFSKH